MGLGGALKDAFNELTGGGGSNKTSTPPLFDEYSYVAPAPDGRESRGDRIRRTKIDPRRNAQERKNYVHLRDYRQHGLHEGQPGSDTWWLDQWNNTKTHQQQRPDWGDYNAPKWGERGYGAEDRWQKATRSRIIDSLGLSDETRGMQQDALSMMGQRAMGQGLIADQVAAQQAQRLGAAAMSGAGSMPYSPRAFRNARRTQAEAEQQLAGSREIARRQEMAAARQAYLSGLGQVRAGDYGKASAWNAIRGQDLQGSGMDLQRYGMDQKAGLERYGMDSDQYYRDQQRRRELIGMAGQQRQADAELQMRNWVYNEQKRLQKRQAAAAGRKQTVGLVSQVGGSIAGGPAGGAAAKAATS